MKGTKSEPRLKEDSRALTAILTILRAAERLPAVKHEEPPAQDPACAFDPCAPPRFATPPQFQIPFRQTILFPDLCEPVELAGTSTGDVDRPHPPFGPLLFNCAQPTDVTLCVSLDLRFQQKWNLLKLSIGDLSSTMALAPAEQLTLEFLTSQRRLLEHNRVDSAEELTSTESATIDKEVINTVQSLSKTQQWHVDGSASFGIPSKLSVEAGAGLSNSVTQTSQATIDHMSEETKKSAHNLKTLHKIEVRGVSESFVQTRMVRKLVNPYRDRTLSVNIFQLLKHFDVESRLQEIRLAFVITVQGLIYDNAFVLSNTDFLRNALLDPALIDDLPLAVQAAGPFPKQNLARAREEAKRALRYLFDEPHIFNIGGGAVGGDRDPLARRVGGPLADPSNSPEAAFDAGLQFAFPARVTVTGALLNRRGFPDGSGLGDAVTNNVGAIFTALAFFYKVYKDIPNDAELTDRAVGLASAIANYPGRHWTTLVEAGIGTAQDLDVADNTVNRVLRNVLDNDSLTEPLRRLSGFVAMVHEMVAPVGGTTDAEAEALADRALAIQALERLLQHLRCNNKYYSREFLAYRAGKTKNQAVIDFVADVLRRVTDTPAMVSFANQFMDLEHPFLDKQQIIVVGRRVLTADDITRMGRSLGSDEELHLCDIQAAVLKDVQVPADGVHLEVAGGLCKLAEVPAGGTSLDMSVKEASLKLESDRVLAPGG